MRGLSSLCAAYIIPALQKNYLEREKLKKNYLKKIVLTAKKKTKKTILKTYLDRFSM